MATKKLLIVVDYFPKIEGGAEKQIFLLSRLLTEKDIPVDILVLQSECLIERQLRENGIGLFCEGIKRVYSIEGLLKARSWYEKISAYDVVMSYHFGADLWLALFFGAVKKTGVRFISNRRDAGFWMRPMHRFVYDKFVNKFFSRCIYVSKFAMDCWPACGQSAVIPNAVDLRDFEIDVKDARLKIRQELGLDEQETVILYTANLFPIKNHSLVIKAVKRLCDRDIKVKAVFAGKDKGSQSLLKDMAEKFGVSDRVLFLGPRSDIPRLISASDICVQVSFSEGMSNTLLEYMAGRRPVIASDIPPNREVAQGCAKFILPNDIDGFSDAVEQIINSKALAEDMVRLAYERIVERFSLKAMVDRYIEELF